MQPHRKTKSQIPRTGIPAFPPGLDESPRRCYNEGKTGELVLAG